MVREKPKNDTYLVEFAGRGVWNGLSQRVVAPIEVQAVNPTDAMYIASTRLTGPITSIVPSRITIKRLQRR